VRVQNEQIPAKFAKIALLLSTSLDGVWNIKIIYSATYLYTFLFLLFEHFLEEYWELCGNYVFQDMFPMLLFRILFMVEPSASTEILFNLLVVSRIFDLFWDFFSNNHSKLKKFSIEGGDKIPKTPPGYALASEFTLLWHHLK